MINDNFTIKKNTSDFSLELKDYSKKNIPMSLATTDYLYVGLYKPFSRMYLAFTTPTAVNGNVVYEYYNGTQWVDLKPKDETFNFTKDGFVYFEKPKDWVKTNQEPVTIVTGAKASVIDSTGQLKATSKLLNEGGNGKTITFNQNGTNPIYPANWVLDVDGNLTVDIRTSTTPGHLLVGFNSAASVEIKNLFEFALTEGTPTELTEQASLQGEVLTLQGGEPDDSMQEDIKLHYVRISVDTDMSDIVLRGINTLFSNDIDLEGIRSNIVSKLNNGETWVLKHEQARNWIIQKLRNIGHRKITYNEGEEFGISPEIKYKDLTAFDILEPLELREVSKYLAISMIYLDELSDEVGDKWDTKGKRYRREAEELFNLFMLKIDKNDNGIQDQEEQEGEVTTRLTWV